MNRELKAYLRLETTVAVAFNFFINGMIAALIYHQVDFVATTPLSQAIDITATCLFIFILTVFFSQASLRRSKTGGILETDRHLIRRLNRLYRRPYLFSVLLGLVVALVVIVLVVPIFALCELAAIPFGVYIILKSISSAVLGGLASFANMYLGMIRL